MPGAGGTSQQAIAGKAEAMFVAYVFGPMRSAA